MLSPVRCAQGKLFARVILREAKDLPAVKAASKRREDSSLALRMTSAKGSE